MSIARTLALRRERPRSLAESARFLKRGRWLLPTPQQISELTASSYAAWVDQELNTPLPAWTYDSLAKGTHASQAFPNSFYGAATEYELTAPSQLRQTCLHAYMEILAVNSGDVGVYAPLIDRVNANIFGNFVDLMRDVTYSPIMARWLTYFANDREDYVTGRMPDENYARELMQLYTIGLWELNLDGTRKKTGELDPADPRYVPGGQEDVPTYEQDDITNVARIFTGLFWSNGDGVTPSGGTFGTSAAGTGVNNPIPLCYWPNNHETRVSKVALQGRVNIPAGTSGPTSLNMLLTALVNHPSCAPYICTRLIRLLTTANPSPQYVARVASVFRDDGTGTVGNLRAVFRAIFLDQEVLAPVSKGLTAHIRDPHRLYQASASLWPRLVATTGGVTGTILGFPTDLNVPPAAVTGSYSFSNGSGRDYRVWNPPSVFGRYPTLYAPQGPVLNSGLASPELFLYSESDLSVWVAPQTWAAVAGTQIVSDSASNPEDHASLTSNVRAFVDKYCLLLTADQAPESFRVALTAAATAENLSTDALRRNAGRGIIAVINASPWAVVTQ